MHAFSLPQPVFYTLQLPTLILLALLAAPLGCLLYWRRLPFFIDMQGHGMLLGAVIAVAAGFPVALGSFFVGLIFIFLTWRQETQNTFMQVLLQV